MKIETTQEINFLKKTLDEKMSVRIQFQQEEIAVKNKLVEKVHKLVCDRFKEFKDGEIVNVTWLTPTGPYDKEVKERLYFHLPNRCGWLSGTAPCDYEIRFRQVNKNGSESKRDDAKYHIPIHRLISIEKI